MNLSGEVLKVWHPCGLRERVILASSAVVIHHQLHSTVRGGEYDKKRGKRDESERGGGILYGK